MENLHNKPEQEPVAWKLVPIDPTDEMLKAMDECSTEGYDERLYAGHAASVYMAAVDVAPTPPQRKPLTDEMVTAAARVLNERQADACGVDRDDQWAIYSDDFKADALAMLKAAHGIGNKA